MLLLSVALKNTEIRLSYLCAYYEPSRLERRPMHAFAADGFHYHIVYNDRELHPAMDDDI